MSHLPCKVAAISGEDNVRRVRDAIGYREVVAAPVKQAPIALIAGVVFVVTLAAAAALMILGVI